MSGLTANFASETPSLDAYLPGELVFGMPGEAGGYYTIHVSQPDANTMRISFLPSKSSMPAIASVDISLPQGPKGDPGEAGSGNSGNYNVEQLVLHTITEDEAASAAYLSFDLPKNYREYILLLYITPCANAINGIVAFNAAGSPWTTGTPVTYNIPGYTTGYRNQVIRFAADGNGMLIPISGYQAFNEAASSHRGSFNPNHVPIRMAKNPNTAPELHELPQNRTCISFGSYAVGYLGAGSIFAVYGIGGYDFVEDDA